MCNKRSKLLTIINGMSHACIKKTAQQRERRQSTGIGYDGRFKSRRITISSTLIFHTKLNPDVIVWHFFPAAVRL